MNTPEYLNSLNQPQREKFVASCKTSENYLRKAASCGQLLREKLCSMIEKESLGAVTRQELRPDDWFVIWPELCVKPSKRRFVA